MRPRYGARALTGCGRLTLLAARVPGVYQQNGCAMKGSTRRIVGAASLVALAAITIIAFGVALELGDSWGREGTPTMFESGDEVARGLVFAARLNNGIAVVAPEASMCVGPDWRVAEKAFPDAEVQFIESEKSEAWYVAFLNEDDRSETYEINGLILDWDIEGQRHGNSRWANVPLGALYACPKRVAVDLTDDGGPRILEFEID